MHLNALLHCLFVPCVAVVAFLLFIVVAQSVFRFPLCVDPRNGLRTRLVRAMPRDNDDNDDVDEDSW